MCSNKPCLVQIGWYGCLRLAGTILMVALVSSWVGHLPANEGGEARFARRGDIALELTLLAKDGTITAGEPLLAQIEIKSQSDEGQCEPKRGKQEAQAEIQGERISLQQKPGGSRAADTQKRPHAVRHPPP